MSQLAGRRCLAIVIIAMAAMTTGQPARAISVPPPAFGLTPMPTPAGVPRPYFQMTISPGGSAADTAIVSNDGTSTERLRLATATGITATNSGSAFTEASGRCAGPGCWVTGLPATVTLPARTGRVLAFRVAVPPGTPRGQYLAGITVESAAPPSPVRAGVNGHASASVIIVSQVNVGVAITVGALARLRTRMAVLAVTSGSVGSLPRLNVLVHNAGQTFARAHGTVSCATGGGRRTFGLVVDTVLPGEDAVLPVNVPGLRAGSMPCTVSLRDQAGGTSTWSGTVVVAPAAGTANTIRIGKGAYATVPATGVPTWAIALLAIGAAILLTLSWLLVLHFRRAG